MKAGGKIALVGFPNAGKTTLFNALTGAHERTGNWHGVTVTARGGKMKKLPCFLYDLPGIYGEEATSPEEKVTREFLEREKDALLLIAVSANDAARGLAAAEHLIKTRKTLVVFTFYDEFSTRGGKIDIAALNAKCFAAAAVDGNDKQDVKRLETALRRALEGGTARKDFRLEEAEKLIIVPPQKKNFLDKVLFHKAGALTAFALLFAFVFYAAFGKYSPSMLLTDLIGNLGKRAADGARAALFRRAAVVFRISLRRRADGDFRRARFSAATRHALFVPDRFGRERHHGALRLYVGRTFRKDRAQRAGVFFAVRGVRLYGGCGAFNPLAGR